MSDVTAALSEAYESEGYTVASVTDNRGQLRVALREEGPDVASLRRIARDVCGEDAIVGLDVTAESTAGDEVQTVVSFRHHP